jgi:hypothetical protein
VLFSVFIDISEEEKDKLLEWLSPDDELSGEKHRSNQDQRVENTGTWFINEFEEWLKNDSEMLLLGTGKRTSSLE